MRGSGAHPPYINTTRAGSQPRHGIKAHTGVIEHLHPWSLSQYLSRLLGAHGVGELNIHRFTMCNENRHSDTSCRDSHFRSMHYLASLLDHLPFFLGIAIIEEYVYLRY